MGGSSSGADSGYSDLVPHLASIDDFLSASRSAVQQNKMLVVKFYSKRCRACLRIAAKYRRIARRYGEQVACYEMEQHAAGRELLELLAVDQVPTTPAITTPALATATVTTPALATAAFASTSVGTAIIALAAAAQPAASDIAAAQPAAADAATAIAPGAWPSWGHGHGHPGQRHLQGERGRQRL